MFLSLFAVSASDTLFIVAGCARRREAHTQHKKITIMPREAKKKVKRDFFAFLLVSLSTRLDRNRIVSGGGRLEADGGERERGKKSM